MNEPSSDGVTVVVRRTVRPDSTDAFEQWLSGINAVSARFDGHLGSSVARPAPGAAPEYVIIFRFDTVAHLDAWEQSPDRADWLSRVDAFTVGPSDLQRITGLEYWFTLPEEAVQHPPPPWKMALVTFVGLFPLVQWLAPAIRGRLDLLPPLLASVVTLAALVALMTWGVMPLLIRLARPWLFPKAEGS